MEDDRPAAEGCACPPALDEIDLIAAVDDEASPEVHEHLSRCASCTARLDALATLQGLLCQRLYRLFCPTSDELVAYREGQMIPEARSHTAAHLAECHQCQEELALLERMTALSPVRPPRLPRRQVVAHSSASSGWFGEGLFGESYSYQAGMIRIVLSVERHNGAGTPKLRGRLSGSRHHPLTASLLANGRVISSAALDGQGAFVLDDLPPGEFSLSVRLPDYEVIVEALRM